jgi:hypothetical protein
MWLSLQDASIAVGVGGAIYGAFKFVGSQVRQDYRDSFGIWLYNTSTYARQDLAGMLAASLDRLWGRAYFSWRCFWHFLWGSWLLGSLALLAAVSLNQRVVEPIGSWPGSAVALLAAATSGIALPAYLSMAKMRAILRGMAAAGRAKRLGLASVDILLAGLLALIFAILTIAWGDSINNKDGFLGYLRDFYFFPKRIPAFLHLDVIFMSWFYPTLMVSVPCFLGVTATVTCPLRWLDTKKEPFSALGVVFGVSVGVVWLLVRLMMNVVNPDAG